MTRSVFRFLSRQPETIEIADQNYLLRLPRFADYRQWYQLRSESRAFLDIAARVRDGLRGAIGEEV